MRVVITGGTGFIGSRLALDSVNRGHDVVVFGQVNTPAEEDNRKQLEEAGVDIQLGAVTERDKVFPVMAGADQVFHLAAAQHEANVPDAHFHAVNVEGTRNVLDACLEGKVKRLIHGSTIGVYGSAAEGEITPESPLQPDNIYGITKMEAERLVLSYRERLPLTVVRISETYGPGDRRLLKLFKAIEKNLCFVIGNGRNKHHLIYVGDLIDGLYRAAASDKALGQVFVLAGKEVVTTRQMMEGMAWALNTRVWKLNAPLWPFLLTATVMETVLRPLGMQPPLHRRRMDFFRKSFFFSMQEANKVLGFEPKTDFVRGAAETVRWYKERGLL